MADHATTQTDASRRQTIDRIFRDQIGGRSSYAEFQASFMRGLSRHADSLSYEERALFLRIASEEVGFMPIDFWDALQAAEGREFLSSQHR